MGLIITTVFFLLGIVSYFIFRKINSNLIKYKLKNVLYVDCLCFEDEKYSKKEFFLREPLNEKKIEYNVKVNMLNYLMGNNSNKNLINKHEDNTESN